MRTPDFSIGERLDASFHTRIRQNEKREVDGKKRFTFIISTGAEDRHETIIDPDGGDVSHYMNNPVVLFNHDYDKVVGRALSIEVKGGNVIAQMEFDDDNEFALEKKGQVERGFLNATSIGFIVKEWTFDEDNDIFKILQWELVEFSIVSVPSNREALVISRDASGLSELKKEIVQLKDMVAAIRQPNVVLGNYTDTTTDNGITTSTSIPGVDWVLLDKQDARQADKVEAADPEPEGILTDPEATVEAETESPADDATHDAEPTAVVEAPSSLEAPRKATTEDYRAIAQQLLPIIQKNVRRSLGKE